MRTTVLIFGCSLLLVFSSSCGNSAQGDAKNLAAQIENTVKENAPGSLPVADDGYTMRAKINGKEWKAKTMMPATAQIGRLIGYYNKSYISFPYDKRNMIPGNKRTISENWAVDFMTEDGDICSSTDGEMVVTKVDGKWVEGTFHFIVNHCMAEAQKTKIEVTDGFFRIPVEP